MPAETQIQPKPPAISSKEGDERDPNYLKIRALVYQACGISHSEENLYLLAGACKRRLPNTKAADARQYLELISNAATRVVELRELLNEITIGETCLFRSHTTFTAMHLHIAHKHIA